MAQNTHHGYAHNVDVNMAEILNTFWKEWKMFRSEDGLYSKRNMWNVKDATEENLAVWHELYSLGQTEVIDYVATRLTSALTGIGTCERS